MCFLYLDQKSSSQQENKILPEPPMVRERLVKEIVFLASQLKYFLDTYSVCDGLFSGTSEDHVVSYALAQSGRGWFNLLLRVIEVRIQTQ